MEDYNKKTHYSGDRNTSGDVIRKEPNTSKIFRNHMLELTQCFYIEKLMDLQRWQI